MVVVLKDVAVVVPVVDAGVFTANCVPVTTVTWAPDVTWLGLYAMTTAPLAKPPSHGTVAWLCKGATCLPPIADPARLREELGLPTIAPSAETNPAPRSPP